MSASGHVNDGAFSRRNFSAAEFGIAFVYSSSSFRLNSGTYLAQASVELSAWAAPPPAPAVIAAASINTGNVMSSIFLEVQLQAEL